MRAVLPRQEEELSLDEVELQVVRRRPGADVLRCELQSGEGKRGIVECRLRSSDRRNHAK